MKSRRALVHVYKKILGVTLGGVLMAENCMASDHSPQSEEIKIIPFKSHQSIYEYADFVNKGTIGIDEIKDCINATIEYYSKEPLPGGVEISSLDEWRGAKIVELLYAVHECFSDMEISPYCSRMIRKICEKVFEKESSRNFQFAKLLLMSQCTLWDEKNKKYKLLPVADNLVIGKAVGMLCSAATGKGKSEDARTLLEDLRNDENKKEFLRFFPVSYIETE